MPNRIEEPLSGGRIEMHVQRHDAHDKGHLTLEGREHAKQVAQEKVRQYLDQNPETNFMVIASNQVFDDNEPDFGGLRAIETAQEITNAIKEALAERGLPEDQLFGGESIPTTSTPTLREAGIFSTGFMKHLRTKYPDDSAWSLYYQDTDPETRQGMGAESPLDLAKRMDYMIKTAEMAGASFHKTPGKEHQPIMVWMVGHGGGLDSYLHHYANVPIEELGFDLSGGFTLKAKDGQIVADVKGKEYPIHTDESFSLPK